LLHLEVLQLRLFRLKRRLIGLKVLLLQPLLLHQLLRCLLHFEFLDAQLKLPLILRMLRRLRRLLCVGSDDARKREQRRSRAHPMTPKGYA
jgi:hypothetical protein